MKHTQEEIIKALLIIQDECNAAQGCRECLFSNGNACNIYNKCPDEWQINEHYEWTPFKDQKED